MTGACRRGASLAALLAFGGVADAQACELLLREHRSGRELARVALDAAVPALRVAFTHSVLGTPVVDRYAWRAGHWVLVEERFEGAGYGLPHAPGPGESLLRDGDGWHLDLARVVDPLVVRPLAAQRMRVSAEGAATELPLASLTGAAVAFDAVGCGG